MSIYIFNISRIYYTILHVAYNKMQKEKKNEPIEVNAWSV